MWEIRAVQLSSPVCRELQRAGWEPFGVYPMLQKMAPSSAGLALAQGAGQGAQMLYIPVVLLRLKVDALEPIEGEEV